MENKGLAFKVILSVIGLILSISFFILIFVSKPKKVNVCEEVAEVSAVSSTLVSDFEYTPLTNLEVSVVGTDNELDLNADGSFTTTMYEERYGTSVNHKHSVARITNLPSSFNYCLRIRDITSTYSNQNQFFTFYSQFSDSQSSSSYRGVLSSQTTYKISAFVPLMYFFYYSNANVQYLSFDFSDRYLGTIQITWDICSIGVANQPIYDSNNNLIYNGQLYMNSLNYQNLMNDIANNISNNLIPVKVYDNSIYTSSTYFDSNDNEYRLTANQYSLVNTDGTYTYLSNVTASKYSVSFNLPSILQLTTINTNRQLLELYIDDIPIDLTSAAYDGERWAYPINKGGLNIKATFRLSNTTFEIYAFQDYQTVFNSALQSAIRDNSLQYEYRIRELENALAESEKGFNLFTPVTSLLNTPLWYFGDTPFTLGLLLAFSLGMTAIFIFLKIFK